MAKKVEIPTDQNNSLQEMVNDYLTIIELEKKIEINREIVKVEKNEETDIASKLRNKQNEMYVHILENRNLCVNTKTLLQLAIEINQIQREYLLKQIKD
jgi:hypothetical protein